MKISRNPSIREQSNIKLSYSDKSILVLILSSFLILSFIISGVLADYQFSQLAQKFLSNTNLFEKTIIWNQLSDSDKIELLKQLTEEGYTLSPQEIAGFPKELKKIKFTTEGIIYEYENGKKLKTAQGHVNENNELIGLMDKNNNEIKEPMRLIFGEQGKIVVNKDGTIAYKGENTGVAFGDKRFKSSRYLDENKKDIYQGQAQVLKEDTFKTKGFVSAGNELNPYFQVNSPIDEIVVDFNEQINKELKQAGNYLHIGTDKNGKKILTGDLNNYNGKDSNRDYWEIRMKFDKDQITQGEIIALKNIRITDNNDILLFRKDNEERTWLRRQYQGPLCSGSGLSNYGYVSTITGRDIDEDEEGRICSHGSRVSWNSHEGLIQKGYYPTGKRMRYYYDPYYRQMRYRGRCPFGHLFSGLGTCVTSSAGIAEDVLTGRPGRAIKTAWRGFVVNPVRTAVNVGYYGVIRPVTRIAGGFFRLVGRLFSWGW